MIVDEIKRMWLYLLVYRARTHVFCRCVTIARKLEVCCLRLLHKRRSTDDDDWKVCVNGSIEKRIESSRITAVGVEEAPKSLKQYDFIVVLGYANGLISLAGVDASGDFHVISHNDSNTARILYVDIHIDEEADKRGEGCLHTFAFLDGGAVVNFSWSSLQQTNVECGEGVIGICASYHHGVIALYANDRIVLRSLGTGSPLKTLEAILCDSWGEGGCAWHPQKKLLAFAGSTAVRYTSAPKWEIYQFGEAQVHSEQIVSLQFAMFGEMVVLLTCSRDKISIWDFDTETTLYSQPASPFRLCALTQLDSREVSLVVFEKDSHDGKWLSTRLSMPEEDKMEVVGSKRGTPTTSTPEKRITGSRNKKLRKMIDMEAEDAGDDDEEEDLFDATGTADIEPEGEAVASSDVEDRHHTRDILGMLDEETSITLIEEMERLKRRVAHLERRSSDRHALTPGSCPPPRDESSQWLLYWDDAGQVTKQGSGDSITLHLHVFSGPNAGYIQKHDRHNCHTAALSNNALVTGSELSFEGSHHSILTFHNLGTNETWERRLKDDSVAAVCVSDDFVAALGNTALYVFSIAGSLLGIYYMKGAPIGIAAKGNLLAVLSQVSSYPKCSTVLSARLLWINGLRGLARNSINRIVSLYDDILVIPPETHISWMSISDQLNLWVADSGGQLIALVPAMASLHKMGGMSLEWVPSLHLSDLSTEAKPDEQRDRIRAFPLYINEQKLCYIRLREGETYPQNKAPLNFMGYTLRKAPLRIEAACGAYMPFNTFNTVLTRDPTLKEMSKTGLVEDVASIPWQQYDEMRHSLTLQRAQIEMLMQLQQAYGFWFKDAETVTQKAISSMGNVERVHDKWLLRMLRKVKGQRQDGNVTFDILRMIIYQRCLDAAADILSEQMDSRQRMVLQEASVLLTNGPAHNAVAPHHETKESSALPRQTSITSNAEEVKTMKRVTNANNNQSHLKYNMQDETEVKPDVSDMDEAKPVQGFTAVDQETKQPANWLQYVFKS